MFLDEAAQSSSVRGAIGQFSSLLRRHATNETGGVASMGNLEDDLILLSFPLVISFEPFAQPMRSDSHDGIEGGVITLIPIIKLASNHILIQFRRAPIEVRLTDQLQKSLLRRRVDEMPAGENTTHRFAHLRFRGRL